mgnify:CR=1 FL=1
MRARARLVMAAAVMTLAAAGCGGDGDGAVATSTTAPGETPAETSAPATTAAAAEWVEATFESGVTVDYPSDWIDWGAGPNGLGLTIPGTADLAVRDAAATGNLLGSMVSDQDDLAGAFDAIVFGMGLGETTVGETVGFTIDGREILGAPLVYQEAGAYLAVTESGGSYAYVWTLATAGDLPQTAIDDSLQVLASISE